MDVYGADGKADRKPSARTAPAFKNAQKSKKDARRGKDFDT